MFSGVKAHVKNVILNECDDIIIDFMKSKLKVNIARTGDYIVFTVKFADHIIAEDKIKVT